MKKNRRRVAITVTPQTLYHLENLARINNWTLGEAVDALMVEALTAPRPIAQRNRPKERERFYHVQK